MVAKPYLWEAGAELEEHSKRKHKIVREYFARYLAVRCQLPQQARFRLAVVEGFAGGGRYACGAVGSPIIFIEELAEVLSEAAHFLVSPTKRRAAIEYVRRGPKASILSAAIEGLLRRHYPELGNVLFEFAPVVGERFATEINAFERIRIAKIRVIRPNASWTEHYTDQAFCAPSLAAVSQL